MSHHYVAKLWRTQRLTLHKRGTFKVSNDHDFAGKVADIVELYLDPPGGAVVLSMDEKTQIQALDCSASELIDHLVFKIPSHGSACLRDLEADDDVQSEREFTQGAAAAVAVAEVRVIRGCADGPAHPARGRAEVQDRPHHGDLDLSHGQAGALDALSARPGRPGKTGEQIELEEARAEVERLRATVVEQAMSLHLHEGKASWD